MKDVLFTHAFFAQIVTPSFSSAVKLYRIFKEKEHIWAGLEVKTPVIWEVAKVSFSQNNNGNFLDLKILGHLFQKVIFDL